MEMLGQAFPFIQYHAVSLFVPIRSANATAVGRPDSRAIRTTDRGGFHFGVSISKCECAAIRPSSNSHQLEKSSSFAECAGPSRKSDPHHGQPNTNERS